MAVSVPTWKRALSGSEFVYQTFLLNKELGRILANKPKKYKSNYSDEIIRTALDALKNVAIASSVFVTKTHRERDYLYRREKLQTARGEIIFVGIASYLFLEIVRSHDYASDGGRQNEYAKLYDQELKIGEMTDVCYKLISGVMKSDTESHRKYIQSQK